MQDEARTRVEIAAEALRDDYDVTTHVCQGSRPGALQELAEKLDAIAMVVGSSHHGPVGRVLAGDVAAGLLHGAPCPVAVAPRGYTDQTIQRIGVAFAATEEGRAAAAAGFGLARRTGASVELLSVVEPSAYTGAYMVPGWVPPVAVDLDTLDRHALGAAERAIAELAEGVRATAEVRHGAVGPTLAEASESLDLLVCGSRGYGRLHSALAGGVSRGLAHASACPLLLVTRRVAPDAGALWRRTDAVSAR
jgi:nucleotide-binding universal stress UspA family protein